MNTLKLILIAILARAYGTAVNYRWVLPRIDENDWLELEHGHQRRRHIEPTLDDQAYGYAHH